MDVVARKEETCFIFGRVWRAGLLVYFEKAANRWYCVFKDAGTLQFARVIFQPADFRDLNRHSVHDGKRSNTKQKSGEHVLTFIFIFQVTHKYHQEYYYIIIL